MAAHTPYEIRHFLIHKNYAVKNAAGYHLGPPTPSTTDGAPMVLIFREFLDINLQSRIRGMKDQLFMYQ